MQDGPAIITRPARTLCLASVPGHGYGYVERVDVLRIYGAGQVSSNITELPMDTS